MNAIIGLPGPSITVPNTMTSTSFPLGGNSAAGLAETGIAGGDRIYLSGVARKPWNPSLVGSKTHPTSWPTTLIPWR